MGCVLCNLVEIADCDAPCALHASTRQPQAQRDTDKKPQASNLTKQVNDNIDSCFTVTVLKTTNYQTLNNNATTRTFSDMHRWRVMLTRQHPAS